MDENSAKLGEAKQNGHRMGQPREAEAAAISPYKSNINDDFHLKTLPLLRLSSFLILIE